MKFRNVEFGIDVHGEKRKFKFPVNVNQSGEFTANIPEEITELFVFAGIDISHSRSSDKAFYSGKTFDDLMEKIGSDVKKYEFMEKVDEKIMIRYNIKTVCTYCRKDGTKGPVVPNGRFVENGDYHWFQGNVETNGTHAEENGILFNIDVVKKTSYKRHDGYEKIHYERLHDFEKKEESPNLNYLEGLVGIPGFFGRNYREFNEMEYTEKRAEFFVNLHKWICELSEKITDFLHPDLLIPIIESGSKFLS